jgi:hypothetical protein
LRRRFARWIKQNFRHDSDVPRKGPRKQLPTSHGPASQRMP